ncbi:unnamed protein product [Leuciscus chuanchicus]
MELFIFIALQLFMEVQSYKAPAVKVSPDVLRESSSVKMICETPADVTVKQCHFYRNSEQKNIKVSPSCELDLTGAEVLRCADVKSPASVDIYCFYTITENGIDKPSSHSPAVTVTVLGSLQKPSISVSDNDVQINIACEIPLSVGADLTCSLYTEDVLLHRSVSQKRQSGENHLCMFYLTHSELFTRSVNSRNLSCDYYINTEPEIRSPRSDTHTIRGLPQAKLTASASVIKETDTVQLSCENTEDLKMEMCYFNINGRESKSELSSSCQLSLTGSQISIWSEGQSSSVRITCYYTVKKSQVLIPSPHSDPVTITIQISTPAAHVTTAMKTSLPLMSTSETYSTADLLSKSKLPNSKTKKTTRLLIIVLVSTGVGVICSGLICLCWFACKKRRHRNKMRSIRSDEPNQGIGLSCSGPAETFSLITSVPDTSQPISVGLEHPESHQDSTPDPTATDSSITSEKSIYQLSEAPAVKVFPVVLSESSSVKMICETPADVTVKQCHFYRNSEQKNIKVSPSCELDLTGAEVLRWADVKSPASVDIYCFYTITEYRINKPSSHSPAVTVTVLGSLQKPIISVSDDYVQINIACEIPLSVRADFTCSLYTEGVLLLGSVSQIQKSQFGEHPFCAFYPSYSELFTRSVNSRNLSCDYYINTEPEIRSPRSDTHTIRVTRQRRDAMGKTRSSVRVTAGTTRCHTHKSVIKGQVPTHRDEYINIFLSSSLGLPQAKLTASASVIKETDTVQLSCENTEDLKMEMCYFNINGRESYSVQSSSCQLSLTGSQISIWSEGQSSSVRITCFYYTVKKSQVLVPSPHSNPVTITIQSKAELHHTVFSDADAPAHTSTDQTDSPNPTQCLLSNLCKTFTYTQQKTNLDTFSFSICWFPLVLVSFVLDSSVCAGLHVSKVFTCWLHIFFVCSGECTGNLPHPTTSANDWNELQKTLKLETFISPSPCAAKNFNDDNFSWTKSLNQTRTRTKKKKKKKKKKNHRKERSACSDIILSGPSKKEKFMNEPDLAATGFPASVLVNKQQKEENEDIYHLYCTIPDKPVHSKAGDQVYSLMNH